MGFTDVGLGDVLRIVRELRQLRDRLRDRLLIKVPRDYVVGDVDITARPMFTDGFVVSFRVGSREYRVWWSSIEGALEGRGGDWGDHRIVVDKEPYIEFFNPDGSTAAIIRLRSDFVNRLENLMNTAFSLFLVDWFIEDDIKGIANIVNVFIPEDYSELRYIGDFVEEIHTRLGELGIIRELEDGVRKIEIECHANNHQGREIVEVIPVGRYYLCRECLRRAEEYVDRTLNKWGSVRIKIPSDTWQGILKSIDYAKEVISNAERQ